MKFEKYKEDGTMIVGYHGGYFRDFNDYESWEPLDPQDEMRLVNFLAGQINNEITVLKMDYS